MDADITRRELFSKELNWSYTVPFSHMTNCLTHAFEAWVSIWGKEMRKGRKGESRACKRLFFLSKGRKRRLDHTSVEWWLFRVSGASRAEETQRQRPHPTPSHWVYLRFTKWQHAGSETGERRETVWRSRAFGSYLLSLIHPFKFSWCVFCHCLNVWQRSHCSRNNIISLTMSFSSFSITRRTLCERLFSKISDYARDIYTGCLKALTASLLPCLRYLWEI